MKTERRHELQTNDLADWLGHQFERVKPYRMSILAGVIAIAVIAIVWAIVAARSTQDTETAWNLYFELTSQQHLAKQLIAAQEDKRKRSGNQLYSIREHPEDQQQILNDLLAKVEQLAELQEGELVGWFAALWVADASLDQAMEKGIENIDEARPMLDRAAKWFQFVIDHADDESVAARARAGLARTLEARGDRSERGSEQDDAALALTEYQALQKDAVYGELAARQQAMLKGDSPSGDFYRWYHERRARKSPLDSPFGSSLGLPGTSGTDSIFDPTKSGPELPGGTGTPDDGTAPKK
ncbi:MAG: hypothetical protein HYS13_10775 [Planctomycetia bacterium]|nr:hypothetical protein [Planctomycetia bacterium]